MYIVSTFNVKNQDLYEPIKHMHCIVSGYPGYGIPGSYRNYRGFWSLNLMIFIWFADLKIDDLFKNSAAEIGHFSFGFN